MDKLLAISLLFISVFKSTEAPFDSYPKTDEQDTVQNQQLPQPVKTESKFETKFEIKTYKLDKKIIFRDDPEKELGEEIVIHEGEAGKKVVTTKITSYESNEYSREVTTTEFVPPKDKIILKGTKIIIRTLDSPDGVIRYWKKLRVWATHYDSKCPGCNEWTAIGMRAGKGVIAVDPKVIPLRSKVYIPNYGIAVAGDTGGAIKGNIIDLGFDDAQTAGWSAKFIDIYLL